MLVIAVATPRRCPRSHKHKYADDDDRSAALFSTVAMGKLMENQSCDVRWREGSRRKGMKSFSSTYNLSMTLLGGGYGMMVDVMKFIDGLTVCRY